MRSGLASVLAVLLTACSFVAVSTDDGGASPTPTAAVTASPTPPVAPASPPAPTSTPEPTASPSADPSAMDLDATSCNGGVVLHWSPSRHPDFHHYIGLRSPERDIAADYPPIAPAVDWGDLYASDRFVTTGFDATVVPSATTWHYRVMAYDVAGRVIGRSNVASARILPHRSLGRLTAEPLEGGGVRIAWRRFDGVPGCFSAYRVLQGSGGVAGTLLSSVSDHRRTELETDALRPGTTYTLRVEAVHSTALGHFVLGESEPLTLVVPELPET
jgi:hypothetical protein